jgi:hypothetical protein
MNDELQGICKEASLMGLLPCHLPGGLRKATKSWE